MQVSGRPDEESAVPKRCRNALRAGTTAFSSCPGLSIDPGRDEVAISRRDVAFLWRSRSDLGQLGLRTVIDLRSGDELADRGRIVWPAPGLAYHHLPMMDVLPEREELPTWVDSSYVAGRYTEILHQGRTAVADTLAVLAEPSTSPAVFHCAAGKDRTGILSAVLLGILGVPDEDIVADYSLSGGAMVRFLQWLRTEYPDAKDELERSSAAIVAAEPETMALFLQRFRSHHGSFEAYVDSLGMAGTVAGLRAALLEL